METKLLKQLKKEAKNKFKIGKINDKYTVFASKSTFMTLFICLIMEE